MPEAIDFSPVVFSPQEAATRAEKKARDLRDIAHRGIEFPLPEVAAYPFAPLIPGQLCVVLAQTSNCKTAFVDYWKDEVVKQLDRQKRYDEAIFLISVEDTLEEQLFFEISKRTGYPIDEISTGHAENWDAVIDCTIELGGVPVYRICNTLDDPENAPELYMTNIVKAIYYAMNRDKIKPALFIFDYLQAFPLDPMRRGYAASDSRRLQIRADVYEARRLSRLAPVILNCQAKQSLGGGQMETLYIPGIYDGEESSSIAQRADRMISLWLPAQKLSSKMNTLVDAGSLSYVVRPELLFMKVTKQRGRLPAGKVWPLATNFSKNIFQVVTDLTDTKTEFAWSELLRRIK